VDTDPAVQRLLDREAITRLVHAYCRHFDQAEPDELAALFTDDAVVDYGPESGQTRGAAALRDSVAVGLATLFAATSHHVSNIEIDHVGPDEAVGHTYLYAWHRYRDGRADSELWGRYLHRFRRTPSGWRIASLELRAAGSRDFHRQRMHPIGRASP
jgi:ketosteroid isomerase-like protein